MERRSINRWMCAPMQTLMPSPFVTRFCALPCVCAREIRVAKNIKKNQTRKKEEVQNRCKSQ